MAVFYETIDVPFPPLRRRDIAQWISKVIELHGKKPGRVCYIFCSDNEILKINLQYLQHDYYTDIITFDYTEKGRVSGDLFVSIDTVKSNAEKYGVTYQQELFRVMIHGVLHLCGYKDKTENDRNVMRKCEDEALILLNYW